MTPKREAYLAKCSDREKLLRWKLKEAKQVLRKYKFAQNRKREIYPFPLTEAQIVYIKKMVYESKTLINVYRHELARLKGMDRVAMPIVVVTGDYLEGYCDYCGGVISEHDHDYCPCCGRRILWEKG